MQTDFELEYTDDLVDELPMETLKDFLYQYNKYITFFYDDHDEGSQPVSMIEFFNNDYQVL